MLPDEQLAGMMELLDGLGQQGFARPVAALARADPAQRRAARPARRPPASAALVGLTLFLTYGAPDPETGQNPNWQAFGYPGPDRRARPTGRRRSSRSCPTGDELDARGRRRASSAPAPAAA